MKLTSKDHKHKEKKQDLYTVHTDNIALFCWYLDTRELMRTL